MPKQPYIPLYIGDWEQDVNALTIEAEGAWLKIIFKCWRNEGSFTGTPEILARVCKVTPEKFVSILLEWELSNICDIERHENGLITLRNRRITRDLEISAKRAVSGKKGMAKRYQTDNKTPNKPLTNTQQIPEYDNDIDNDIENRLKEALNEIYIDQQRMKWTHIDFDFEHRTFCEKVRGAPDKYRNHDKGGLVLAFQSQLRSAKAKPKNGTTTNKSTEHVSSLVEGYKRRYGGTTEG